MIRAWAAVRWHNVFLAEELGWYVAADDYYGAWMALPR